MRRRIRLLVVICLLFLLAFNSSLTAAPAPLRITSIARGAVVPANWLHPLVEWEDTELADAEYAVEFRSSRRSLGFSVRGPLFTPTAAQFAPFLNDGGITITVSRPGAADAVKVRVAAETFDDTIVYRLVEPLFNPSQAAILNVLRLTDEKPESRTVHPSLCLGCHAHQNQSSAFNVRRDRDRRLVTRRPPAGEPGFVDRPLSEFSFAAFSPDGKTLALGAATRSVIVTRDSFLEPFDMTYTAGDIYVLRNGAAAPQPLPGASDPAWVEDMPGFSPDGRTIVFCRYQPWPGVPRLRPVSLYTIPAAGGSAAPLLSRAPAPFCYFPRYSPDGRWISFVTADASRSYFARTSSDIWLYSVENKTVKKLESNRDDVMDSWHAWSADGSWLVFASNRDSNRLTALYLTRIDSSGRAAPPVKISRDPGMKANLPYIVPGAFKLDASAADFLRGIYPPSP